MTTTTAGLPAAATAAITATQRNAQSSAPGGASAIAPLTWLETSVAVLSAARRPMRAREIVETAQELGCVPPSRSKTPWQSVNRDLHAALRRGDERIVLGPGPGQFVASGVRVAAPRTATAHRGRARTESVIRVPRLPIAPLAALIEARDGLRSCGIRHYKGESDERSRWVERLHRGYLRSRNRGWINIYDADELAVKAVGLHPSQVWDEDWWDAIEVPGAGAIAATGDPVDVPGSKAVDTPATENRQQAAQANLAEAFAAAVAEALARESVELAPAV